MPFNCLLVAMDLSNLVNAVCQALLHSLWLGVVAALLAGIVIVLTTRSQPAGKDSQASDSSRCR